MSNIKQDFDFFVDFATICTCDTRVLPIHVNVVRSAKLQHSGVAQR